MVTKVCIGMCVVCGSTGGGGSGGGREGGEQINWRDTKARFP